ncbi:hypothetical protein EYV94_03285 [Puteibacter caeruleilacunae]|nr:hypothetical protein EYV94_03285 [Puteibacter caeruleilacunae]
MRMYKFILVGILFTLGTLLAGKAVAQDQQVTQGAQKDYSVNLEIGNNASLEFHWSVSGGSSTDLSGNNSSSINITWDGSPGIYTLSVYVIDGNNCKSDPVERQIQILGAGDVLINGPNLITCSQLNDGSSGNTKAEWDLLGFNIEISGGLSPYTVQYTILNDTNTAIDGYPQTLTSYESGANIDVPNNFVNNGTTDDVYTIEILDVKSADGADIPLGTDIKRTITVHPKPTISTIKMEN